MGEHYRNSRTNVTRVRRKLYLSLNDLKTPQIITHVSQNIIFNELGQGSNTPVAIGFERPNRFNGERFRNEKCIVFNLKVMDVYNCPKTISVDPPLAVIRTRVTCVQWSFNFTD